MPIGQNPPLNRSLSSPQQQNTAADQSADVRKTSSSSQPPMHIHPDAVGYGMVGSNVYPQVHMGQQQQMFQPNGQVCLNVQQV